MFEYSVLIPQMIAELWHLSPSCLQVILRSAHFLITVNVVGLQLLPRTWYVLVCLLWIASACSFLNAWRQYWHLTLNNLSYFRFFWRLSRSLMSISNTRVPGWFSNSNNSSLEDISYQTTWDWTWNSFVNFVSVQLTLGSLVCWIVKWIEWFVLFISKQTSMTNLHKWN